MTSRVLRRAERTMSRFPGHLYYAYLAGKEEPTRGPATGTAPSLGTLSRSRIPAELISLSSARDSARFGAARWRLKEEEGKRGDGGGLTDTG